MLKNLFSSVVSAKRLLISEDFATFLALFMTSSKVYLKTTAVLCRKFTDFTVQEFA